jgi:hypothetical protein
MTHTHSACPRWSSVNCYNTYIRPVTALVEYLMGDTCSCIIQRIVVIEPYFESIGIPHLFAASYEYEYSMSACSVVADGLMECWIEWTVDLRDDTMSNGYGPPANDSGNRFYSLL